MKKTPETPEQFDQRLAEFENNPDSPKIIYEPESVTMQRITAGENARAKEIAAQCRAESPKALKLRNGCIFKISGRSESYIIKPVKDSNVLLVEELCAVFENRRMGGVHLADDPIIDRLTVSIDHFDSFYKTHIPLEKIEVLS